MKDAKPPKKFLLKDQLINGEKVARIAGEIRRVHHSFKKDDFTRQAVRRFPELELKARITWIAECLKAYLPDDYRRAVEILVRALPEPNDPDLSDDDFGDFIYAPYGDFVAKYGITRGDLEFSLGALREMTMRFSAEDSIRYFINAFAEPTLAALAKWSTDSHYHVRRLCSEGTRPKLPWARKIDIPVTAPLPILGNLYADPTRYVTRSVANHINDISKIDSGLAIATLSKWKRSKKQNAKEMDFIIRHALRTLVKQGNPEALKLLGVAHDPDVKVSDFKVPDRVTMNTALEFSVKIHARENTEIIADYVMYFQNKSGQQGGRKVFKLKQCSLAGGQTATLTKRHMLREHMTTRKLFRGKHEVELQINGKSYGKKAFTIV